MNKKIGAHIVFFGTPDFAVWTLESMREHGLIPDLIVAAPDKPAGRKLALTPPAAKMWAEKHGVPVMQPENVKDAGFMSEIEAKLGGKPDLFVVAAYGKILPKALLEAPREGTINVHPSLLPLLRGASPIQTAILNDMRDTGVTVMRIDEELDHGPMLAQKEVSPADWPLDSEALGRLLAREGGALIAEMVPQVIAGTARETPQDHAEATFSRKIEKEDGLIDLSADAYENLLKVKAYKEWPTAYFFAEKGGKKIRITIKDASEKDGVFTILRAIPEGKKEMSGDELSRFLAS